MIIAGKIVSPESVTHAQNPRRRGHDCRSRPPARAHRSRIRRRLPDFRRDGRHPHPRPRRRERARDAYEEDFRTAAAAAIHGGVVQVADMPNNPSAPIDDASYRAKRRHLESREVPIAVTLYAGIGPGTRPLSFAVPYKVYMGPSVGDLFFTTLDQLDETLSHYRGCNVSFHCEDPVLLAAHGASRRTSGGGLPLARSRPRGSPCR